MFYEGLKGTTKKRESKNLKVQPCKLFNNKYVIASIHIPNSENFAFIAVRVFTLLRRKALFTNKKDNINS